MRNLKLVYIVPSSLDVNMTSEMESSGHPGGRSSIVVGQLLGRR